jgi:hypothetical protein
MPPNEFCALRDDGPLLRVHKTEEPEGAEERQHNGSNHRQFAHISGVSGLSG